MNKTGSLDEQPKVWLILFLFFLVEKDLGDLSYRLAGLGRLFISSPIVYAFKSGLYALRSAD